MQRGGYFTIDTQGFMYMGREEPCNTFPDMVHFLFPIHLSIGINYVYSLRIHRQVGVLIDQPLLHDIRGYSFLLLENYDVSQRMKATKFPMSPL